MVAINLFKQNPPTLTQVEAKLAAVQRDVEQMRARQTTIEELIAQNWGSDTSQLETEYGMLAAKLRAADHVLEQLAADRKQAHRQALIDDFAAKCRQRTEKSAARRKADEKLAAIWEKAVTLYATIFAPADSEYKQADNLVESARSAAQAAGVTFEELTAIESQYPYADYSDLAPNAVNALAPWSS